MASLNVLLYVKIFIDRTKIKMLVYFLCSDYTFILSPDILMLMKTYFLVMKGKKCNNENQTKAVMDVEQVCEQQN